MKSTVCACVSVLDILVVFRSADDGDGLRQHQLIRTVSVEVNAGEEGRLCGVGLNTQKVKGHTPRYNNTQVRGHTQEHTGQRSHRHKNTGQRSN